MPKKSNIKIAQMLKAVEAVLTAREKNKACKRDQKKIAAAEKRLRAYGKAKYNKSKDWTTIYSDREQPIPVAKADGHGATKKSSNNCLVARSVRKSELGAYITGVDVGTNITKVWSDACRIEVRFATSHELAKAVRIWDKPNGKWVLPDSTYWLRAYPKSLRVGYTPKNPRKINPGNTAHRKKAPPSRKIMNIHSNTKAIELANILTKKR